MASDTVRMRAAILDEAAAGLQGFQFLTWVGPRVQ